MATRPTQETHAKPVNLRIRADVCSLIDRAAKLRGVTRSTFMIDAAHREAEDMLLDQALVTVDAATYQQFLAVLDRPPGGGGFARLMSAPKPWQE